MPICWHWPWPKGDASSRWIAAWRWRPSAAHAPIIWSCWVEPRRGCAAMAKRVFDCAGRAGAAAAVAADAGHRAVVKLDSRGPVFFRQQRVGRHGVLFRIHKFRSMVADAPQRGPALTVGADARITRVGRWLRRTRLDELPQFIDVLAGHMSLVGPRPEVPQYVAHYPAALRERALSVRPGITDPSSLLYLDESELLARAADPRARVHRGHPAAQAAMCRRLCGAGQPALGLRRAAAHAAAADRALRPWP